MRTLLLDAVLSLPLIGAHALLGLGITVILPAFVAALIGGLESIPGVLAGSAVIGLVQGVVPAMATLPAAGHVFQGVGAPRPPVTSAETLCDDHRRHHHGGP